MISNHSNLGAEPISNRPHIVLLNGVYRRERFKSRDELEGLSGSEKYALTCHQGCVDSLTG